MNRAVTGVLLAAVLLTGGCTRNAADAKPTVSAGVPPAVSVATVDFPSTWLAEQVGGDAVRLQRVTPAELAGTDADLVAYVAGLDADVDAAVATLPEDRVLNIVDDVGQIDRPDQAGSKDPYVWFDPVNIPAMASALGEKLASVSARPFEAYDYYGLRTLRVSNEALEIDQRLQEQLNPCRIATLVVQQPVLTYLARAYGLQQVPLADWRPRRQSVEAVYLTPDLASRVRGVRADITIVPIDTLARSAPEGDLLQGIVATAGLVAEHQDCPLVTAGATDRPG